MPPPDREPTPIGQAVYEAMKDNLGEAGYDVHVPQCDQTLAERVRTAAEEQGRSAEYYRAALADILSLDRRTDPAFLARPATIYATRVQEKIARRLTDEEHRFRQATQALFAWSQRTAERGAPQ